MAAATTIALVGMGLAAATGAVGAGVSASRAGRRARGLQGALENLENNRQPIINPFDEIEDVSGLATNLSDRITNPYADLAVATQAAEIQAEEADIALANTLDTLRATGASAGGATALAQAALKSKQGIAANIEIQEAQNDKLRAQGEQQRQQAIIDEEIRMQGLQISEAQRVQQADAQGLAYTFEAQEARDNAEISRLYSQMRASQLQQEQSRSDAFGSIAGAFGNVGMFAASPAGQEAWPGN